MVLMLEGGAITCMLFVVVSIGRIVVVCCVAG